VRGVSGSRSRFAVGYPRVLPRWFPWTTVPDNENLFKEDPAFYKATKKHPYLIA
jgi:hypothetical protein